MEMYANVGSSDAAPPTPPRMSRPSKKTRAPKKENPEDGEDGEAPPVPAKDPELLKELENNIVKHGPGQPTEDKPVPQRRRNVNLKAQVPVPVEEIDGTSPPPGVDNPFYDGIIMLNAPPAKAPPAKGKADSPKKKRIVKAAAKTQPPPQESPAQDAEPPLYDVAGPIPGLDEHVDIEEHSDVENQPPQPSQPEMNSRKPKSKGGNKTRKSASPNAMGSITVDKYFYNFIWTYKGAELQSIQEKCKVRTKEVASDSSRDIEVRFIAKDKTEVHEHEEKFIKVYQQVQPQLWVESIDLSEVNEVGDLQNELENRFQINCFHVGEKQLDVVSDRKDLDAIKACVADHGGTPISSGTSGTPSPPIRGASKRAGPQKPPKADISFPVGYGVGGAFQIYIYQADITCIHVEAVVNAANGHLKHGGGVARAIANAAGPELEKECREIIKKQHEVPESHVVKTTAGKMPSKMVLHAVGPRWPTKDEVMQGQCSEVLTQTFENVINTANKEGVKTIAIPPISSGIYAVPAGTVANAIYTALVNSADKAVAKSKLREVHIVDIGDSVLVPLVRYFGKGGRIKAPSGKYIALMEIPPEEIHVGPRDRQRQLIADSLAGTGTISGRKKSKNRSSIFGGLCGKGSKRNKYN